MKCVILIPGIMGSGLRNEAGSVWPPTALEAVFGYERICELSDPNLKVTGIIRNVSLVSVYESLMSDIQRCGYHEGSSERRYLPFPYDWRRSNCDSANALAASLDAAFPDPTDLEVTILAHSMGGLVSRYLLESGEFNDRPWFSRIRQLVTLGTPHHGAPIAIKRLAGEEGTLGLSGADIKRLGNDERYPSLFELIGYSGNGLTARRGRRGTVPATIDPFAPEIADTLSMNSQNVQKARDFWGKLNAGTRPSHVNYFCVASSALKTIVRSEVQQSGASPVSIDQRDAGDGTVPFPSAVLRGVPTGYSRKKHSAIFEDRDVRKRLYEILDAPQGVKPQAAEERFELGDRLAIGLSVGQETYRIGEPIELSVSYTAPIRDRQDFFKIVRYDPTTEQVDPSYSPIEVGARFQGTDISGFSFTITSNLAPGIYEVRPKLDADDPKRTFFFVVESNGNGS